VLLEIAVDGAHVLVDGNECPKGEDYGFAEATAHPDNDGADDGRRHASVPVRSFGEVLLMETEQLMREIDSIVVDQPIHCGDGIKTGVCGIDVDLMATDDPAGAVPANHGPAKERGE
jgi:CxxC motif-containing protein